MKKTKKWNDYLWIISLLYLILGFFNILFAWLGLLCFFIPLLVSAIGGNKTYCHHYCGKGQLFHLLGNKFGLSRKKSIPAFLRSKWFRYGFLIFFMAMFVNMIVVTVFVFLGMKDLSQFVTLLWTFKVPWHWAYLSGIAPWIGNFAFGFYSIMLTSTILGAITMLLYKPRSWCVYCPMGTMTQVVCKMKSEHSA